VGGGYGHNNCLLRRGQMGCRVVYEACCSLLLDVPIISAFHKKVNSYLPALAISIHQRLAFFTGKASGADVCQYVPTVDVFLYVEELHFGRGVHFAAH